MKSLKLVFLTVNIFLGSATAPLMAQTSQSAGAINGNWVGVLAVVADVTLRLRLKVTAAADGSLTALMDSPDQNASNVTVDSVTFQNGVLRFEMKAQRITYEGSLLREGEILGTFTQRGAPTRLILRKEGVTFPNTPVKRGRVELKPCNDPFLTSEVLCGKHEVFEDRTARTGRRISLNLVLLPALSSKPAPDPVFYMAGGPGGAATSYAKQNFMNGLRRNRDVVLVDQRGTGQSNLLDCPAPGSLADMRGYFGEVMPLERIRACRAELEKIADLKLYTTTIAMDDIDEVRSALGYEQINVYGGSYGSTTTLAYLRQYPEHVRTIAVSGVAPFSMKLPLSFSRGVQDSVDRLFADCAADAACHAAYPDLANDFKTVIAQFDKGPVEVSAVNPFTRSEQKVTVTRDAFVDSIRQILYQPSIAAALPALIHMGAKGNLGPLVANAFPIVMSISSSIARGMQFSVICGEQVPFITPEEIKTTSANSFYGDARVRPTLRACTEWPRAKVDPSFLDPVKSDKPALVIAGQLDPVTPPWLAEQVARTLSHSRLVVAPNATHNSYECLENLVADFIDKGTTEGLDVSCVNQIKRPPFLIVKD
jgi:pimeloyl-ACP methyl ester carboxylesterase